MFTHHAFAGLTTTPDDLARAGSLVASPLHGRRTQSSEYDWFLRGGSAGIIAPAVDLELAADDAEQSASPLEARVVLHTLHRTISKAMHLGWRATRSGIRRYPQALFDSMNGVTAAPTTADTITFAGLAATPLAAAWLGHGSILIRLAGLTVLLDPVFSNRIGVRFAGRTFGLARHDPLPFTIDALPPVDLVLLTHAHFDHLDVPTLQALANPQISVITARETASLVPKGFREVIELDWNREHTLTRDAGQLHITALRPRHWGARTALDRSRGYNSYVLRDTDGRGVLLTGDTAMTDAFDRLRDLELAAFGIGSYEPWNHAHATPEEAWAMYRAATANSPRARLLPVHHSTFPLGDEPRHEPLERLNAIADTPDKVIEPTVGTIWTPPANP